MGIFYQRELYALNLYLQVLYVFLSIQTSKKWAKKEKKEKKQIKKKKKEKLSRNNINQGALKNFAQAIGTRNKTKQGTKKKKKDDEACVLCFSHP